MGESTITSTGWHLLKTNSATLSRAKTEWGISKSTVKKMYYLNVDRFDNNDIVEASDWTALSNINGELKHDVYWVYVEYDSEDDGFSTPSFDITAKFFTPPRYSKAATMAATAAYSKTDAFDTILETIKGDDIFTSGIDYDEKVDLDLIYNPIIDFNNKEKSVGFNKTYTEFGNFENGDACNFFANWSDEYKYLWCKDGSNEVYESSTTEYNTDLLENVYKPVIQVRVDGGSASLTWNNDCIETNVVDFTETESYADIEAAVKEITYSLYMDDADMIHYAITAQNFKDPAQSIVSKSIWAAISATQLWFENKQSADARFDNIGIGNTRTKVIRAAAKMYNSTYDSDDGTTKAYYRYSYKNTTPVVAVDGYTDAPPQPTTFRGSEAYVSFKWWLKHALAIGTSAWAANDVIYFAELEEVSETAAKAYFASYKADTKKYFPGEHFLKPRSESYDNVIGHSSNVAYTNPGDYKNHYANGDYYIILNPGAVTCDRTGATNSTVKFRWRYNGEIKPDLTRFRMCYHDNGEKQYLYTNDKGQITYDKNDSLAIFRLTKTPVYGTYMSVTGLYDYMIKLDRGLLEEMEIDETATTDDIHALRVDVDKTDGTNNFKFVTQKYSDSNSVEGWPFIYVAPTTAKELANNGVDTPPREYADYPDVEFNYKSANPNFVERFYIDSESVWRYKHEGALSGGYGGYGDTSTILYDGDYDPDGDHTRNGKNVSGENEKRKRLFLERIDDSVESCNQPPV